MGPGFGSSAGAGFFFATGGARSTRCSTPQPPAIATPLRGVVAAVDGSGEVRRALTGPIEDPVGLGARLAHLLLEDGAADLIPDLTRLKTATERDL